MKRKIQTACLTLALTLAAAPMINATAAMASEEPVTSGRFEREFSTTTAADYSDHAILGPSPANCQGTTDYAHYSDKWGPRMASVHGRTVCDSNVPEVSVTTSLEKLGWLWWDVMASDTSSQVWKNTSQDAHPHWGCGGWGEQTYRGESDHFSFEGNMAYYAHTVGAENRFNC